MKAATLIGIDSVTKIVKKGGRWFSATRPGYRRRDLKRRFDFGVG